MLSLSQTTNSLTQRDNDRETGGLGGSADSWFGRTKIRDVMSHIFVYFPRFTADQEKGDDGPGTFHIGYEHSVKGRA